eukprot:scaffold436_cov267-Pinguiococcus_pyrenoidosus.AAC.14
MQRGQRCRWADLYLGLQRRRAAVQLAAKCQWKWPGREDGTSPRASWADLWRRAGLTCLFPARCVQGCGEEGEMHSHRAPSSMLIATSSSLGIAAAKSPIAAGACRSLVMYRGGRFSFRAEQRGSFRGEAHEVHPAG